MATTADAEPVRAVLRLRTLGPCGLNPPQVGVIDRLQTLSEGEDSTVIERDVDVWEASRGLTQTADRDLEEWRPADSEIDGEGQQAQIVTPLITLAVYNETGERLQAVYPHVDGEDVQTIHDGAEALESMAGPGDAEQSQDEHNEQEDLAVPSSNMSPLPVDQDDSGHACTDCEWQTGSDDEHSESDRTKQAIRHHVETAHTVVHGSGNQQTDYSRF